MADDGSLSGLAADLVAASQKATQLTELVIAKTAADIERDAKLKAPVDTGLLRSSISTTRERLTAEIGPTASYGGYVELGTSRAAPQPYLRPAFDRNLPNFEKALERIADL